MNTLAQELRPFPYLGLAPRGNPIEAQARGITRFFLRA
jgi:hypothetical protein